MLIALWLFATGEGVGSSRQLERLCERDDAYRWICGGVELNYHTLWDSRIDRGAALDNWMTQALGVLMNESLVRLKRVAQDGVRVRANAGAASFRSAKGLKKCLQAAQEQMRATKAMLDKDDPTRNDKMREAAERAARGRVTRVEKAMEEFRTLQASKKTAEEAERVRASTTDPEARVMHMADGGYTSLDDIQAAGEEGVKVLAPVPQPKSCDIDPHQPKKDDDAHVAAWRKCMGTDEAEETYKLRAATPGCTNADLRTNRGLQQLPVRGSRRHSWSDCGWPSPTTRCCGSERTRQPCKVTAASARTAPLTEEMQRSGRSGRPESQPERWPANPRASTSAFSLRL